MGGWGGVCKSTGTSWFLKSYTDCDPVPDQIDNKNKKRMGKVPITLSNLVVLALD